MNERIKELMMVALQEQYGDAATPGAREAALELVSGWGTKFAELIVQECVDIADCYDNGSSDEWDKSARAISGHIKRTFRVTE